MSDGYCRCTPGLWCGCETNRPTDPFFSDGPTIGTGDLAYFDTFSGLVPCRIVSVTDRETYYGRVETDVVVKLTATRGAYLKGELVTADPAHVVPRQNVRRSGGHLRINTRYVVRRDA